jgi:uracil-DNA glycosylase family 4
MKAVSLKRRKLNEIQAKYKKCTECPLHEKRRTSLQGYGNPDAKIVFIFDRQSPIEASSGDFLKDTKYLEVIQVLFNYIGRSYDDFWFTPLVACPTAIIPTNTLMPIEHVPLPKNKEIDACSLRIAEEIHVIEPRIVVALGQPAARALIKKNTPSIHYNLNEIHEGRVQGDYIQYPIPVVLTYSLHALLTVPDTNEGGTWHKTAQAIHKAIEISDFMESMKWHVSSSSEKKQQ